MENLVIYMNTLLMQILAMNCAMESEGVANDCHVTSDPAVTAKNLANKCTSAELKRLFLDNDLDDVSQLPPRGVTFVGHVIDCVEDEPDDEYRICGSDFWASSARWLAKMVWSGKVFYPEVAADRKLSTVSGYVSNVVVGVEAAPANLSVRDCPLDDRPALYVSYEKSRIYRYLVTDYIRPVQDGLYLGVAMATSTQSDKIQFFFTLVDGDKWEQRKTRSELNVIRYFFGQNKTEL